MPRVNIDGMKDLKQGRPPPGVTAVAYRRCGGMPHSPTLSSHCIQQEIEVIRVTNHSKVKQCLSVLRLCMHPLTRCDSG